MSSDSVECYSGQTYAERPVALHWEGERQVITEILSRWRLPGMVHFLVRIASGQTFDLMYNETEDLWKIERR